MPTITLAPTANFDGSLDTGIINALASGEPTTVILQPSGDGTLRHFTRPGPKHLIKVGAGGLRLLGALTAGAPRPVVERPKDSIGPVHMDSNYGLYFIPSDPTLTEQAGIVWKEYIDPDGDAAKNFSFGIILRGSVTVRGIVFDCNMGQQAKIPIDVQAQQIEHSAMLGFRGNAYTVSSPGDPKRIVFVGFERVTVEECLFLHGGHSDELVIDRGYFHPNIGGVTLRNIEARERVNFKRASIDFTGLARSILMQNLDVESIRMEPTGKTRQYPRNEEPFRLCEVVATSIEASRVSLSAKGDACRFIGTDWNVNGRFAINELRGALNHSTLVAAQGQDSRMIGMHNFQFNDVEWHFKPNAQGLVSGLRPMSDDGEPCSVRFTENRFVIDTESPVEELSGAIFSSAGFAASAGNVSMRADECIYPNSFGNDVKRPIADIRAKGNWRFARADLGDRPIDIAIKFVAAHGTLTASDDFVRVVVDS